MTPDFWEPWLVPEPQLRWHESMQQQTAHEALCEPCGANRTPACAEGERLQQAAHTAHADWVVSRYGGARV